MPAVGVLGCLLAYFTVPASFADSPIQSSPTLSDAAQAPIRLREKRNIGFQIELLPPYRNRGWDQLLVSLNGKKLKGLSLEQIIQKLKGAPRSLVRAEVIDASGQTDIVEVARQSNMTESLRPQFSPASLYYALRGLGRTQSRANLLENDSTNVDVVAKDYCTDNVQRCEDRGIGNDSDCAAEFVQSMLLSQAIGDFKAADDYLAKCIDFLKRGYCSSVTGNRFPLRRMVKNLVALGEQKEASFFCEKLLDEAYQKPPVPDQLRILEAYSLIKSPDIRSRQMAMSNKLYPLFLKDSTPFTQNVLWFADYLETLGWNDKALAMYSAEEKRLRKRGLEPHNLYSFQPLAFCLYNEARLESLVGDKQLAAIDLEKTVTLYKDNLAQGQSEALDKMPGYFPAPSDVQSAQTALNQSAPIVRGKPDRAPYFEAEDEYDTEGHPVSIELAFPLAQKCFSQIKTVQKSDAEQSAKELLLAYSKQVQMRPYGPTRQNLFCTIIRVARMFSDNKWYQSSNDVLNQLGTAMTAKNTDADWTAIAEAIIGFEHLVNDLNSVKNSQALWEHFKKIYPLANANLSKTGRSVSDHPWSERLRLLAMAYHFAGEPLRAKILIDEALRANRAEQVGNYYENTPVTRDGASEQFLLFADAGCVSAKAGDSLSANKYFDTALNEHFVANEFTTAAILEAATTYQQAAQIDKAILLLEKFRAVTLVSARPQDQNYALVDVCLANFLHIRNRNAEALKVLSDSIAKNAEGVEVSGMLLAAKLSEESKDFGGAAKYYAFAGQDSPYARNNQEFADRYLRKSIECAEASKNYDSSALSDLYIKLANQVQRTNLSETIAIREKALALLQDSDPKKVKLLSENAYLRGEVKRQQEKKSGAPNTLDPHKQNEISSDELKDALRAAQLAAQNKSIDERTYLLRLAALEAQSNKVDLAFEHAKRAISCYTDKDPAARTPEQIMAYDVLQTAERTTENKARSEQLLKAAVQRVKEVNGASSIPAQAQMAHFFQYYVTTKEYVKAEDILDQILKTNLGQGNYSLPDHNGTQCGMGPLPLDSSHQVIGMIENTAMSCDFDFAVKVLNKLLNAERNQFPSDDRRIGLTLVCLAKIYSSVNQFEKSDKTYINAIAILKKYEPMQFVLSNLYPDYYNVLRKVNKQSLIDKYQQDQADERKQNALKQEPSAPLNQRNVGAFRKTPGRGDSLTCDESRFFADLKSRSLAA